MNHPSQPDTLTVRTCTSSNALKWIAGGFSLFKKDVSMWMVTIVVGFCLFIAMGLIPVLGQVVSMLLTYVWVGGLMLGCHAAFEGKPFDVKYLFAGFQQNLLKLVQLSAIMGVSSLIILSLVMGADTMNAAANLEQMSQAEAEAFTQAFLLRFLFVMLLMLPLFMAAWFAPALIVFHNLSVFDAMRASVEGCLKNVVPFLLYGVVTMALYIVALIPFLLGLLIVLPVIIVSIYLSYRDIFLVTGDQTESISFEA